MKNSMIFAVALCGALAFGLTGCKYGTEDAADLSADATLIGTDVASEVDPNAVGADVATNTAADDEAARLAALQNADAVSLDAATQVPFDQDPNFVRCTDVDFAPVYFGFDSNALPAAELQKIEAVAQHLQEKNRVVIVEGNCDERGSNEYNLALGETRAIAIHDYLLKLGIPADRVQTKSYGEEKPAVMGANEAAWSKNRRGEFAVFQHK